MGTYLLFYLFLYPLAILPISVLYGISYPFYILCNYIIRYRREIITMNLRNSFPEKSEEEIVLIRKKYYQHVAQLAAEMIKMLAISRRSLKKRYFCANPEIVNDFYDQGKSVILMSSHYNNWEWMVLSCDSFFKQRGMGLGKANSNKIFEKLINRARTRYGTEVIFADTARDYFKEHETTRQLTAYMMLCDQSPGDPKKSYKTYFLNQPTGIIYGAEYYAKKYDIPVVYYQVIKDRTGYYHLEFELISATPNETGYGEITRKYVDLLEETIKARPEFWLWSHKRWKHFIQIDQEEQMGDESA